jgi:hypothetical protein
MVWLKEKLRSYARRYQKEFEGIDHLPDDIAMLNKAKG